MNPSLPRPSPYRDETSLSEVMLGILRFERDFARLIVTLALLTALLAAAFVVARPAFQARAILDVPKFSLDEWRRLAPILHDSRLVAGTLAAMEQPATGSSEAAEREQQRKLFERPSFWSRQVQYRSALQRDDIREVPNADLRAASTLGIEIALRAGSREAAIGQIDAAGRHIAQSMLWAALDGFRRDQNAIVTNQRPMLELRLTKLAFEMEQTRARSADMRRLMDSFPERSDATAGTIVSPENGGSRFLSPFAQWVSLETRASELQADMRATRRELERLDWLGRFLTAKEDRGGSVQSGFVLADSMEAAKKEVFGSAGTAAATQARDEISLAIAEARARAGRIGLAAAPIVDPNPVWTRSPLPVAAIALLAAMAALSLALALYRLMRTLDRPAGEVWLASHDPLFSWLPARLRRVLFPYESRASTSDGS